MNKLRIAALPVVAALVLTACSSSTSGSATNTGTTAAGTTAESTLSAASTSSASSTSADDTGDSSVAPADLDEDSINWFNTFCGSISSAIPQLMGAMSGAMGGMTGGPSMSPQEMQQTVSSAFDDVATTMADTATALSSTPAPGFDNGEEAATKMIAALQGYSDALAKAASDLASATITTQDDFDQKMQDINDQMDAAGEGIDQALGSSDDIIPPGVLEAAEQLPACAFMAGGDSSTTTS